MPQGYSTPLDKFDTKSGKADIDVGGVDKNGKPTPTWMKEVPIAQETAVTIQRLQTLLGSDASAAVPFLSKAEVGAARITELLVAGDEPQAVSARAKLNAVLSGGLTHSSDNLTTDNGHSFDSTQLQIITSRLKPVARTMAG